MENNNRRIAELKLKTIIAQEYVQERLHKPELYRQVAEEAADFAQACLKYAKALEGTDSSNSYWGLMRVIDLYAGLMNTAEITDIPLDPEIKLAKAQSWADRLSAGREEKEAVTMAEAMREKQELDKETEERLRPFFPELEDGKNDSQTATGIRTRTFFPEEEVLGKTVDRLKVNTILLKKGILTKEIFKLAGLSESTYYKILTGLPVSLASKYKLANALGVNLTEILKESEGANNE